MDLLVLSDFIEEREEEVLDQILDRYLIFIDLRIDFRPKLDEEGDETWEIEFVEMRVSLDTSS